MVHRFIRKPLRKKLVRLKRNRMKAVSKTQQVPEAVENNNNEVKTIEDMNKSDENLKQVEALLNIDEKDIPKKKAKVVKKDRSIIERTDTVLLTEDNKMVLND